jgi:cytoskeletal protein RodZ
VYSGRRSAWRSRKQRSGLARVAAQLIAPVVLGLLIGGVLAYQAGSTNDAVHPVPLGAVPSPTPSFGQPSASAATASAAPTTTASAEPTATASAEPTATASAEPTATASAAATTIPAATTTTDGNCGVIVPVNPPSAPRLAAFYQLTATANGPGRC